MGDAGGRSRHAEHDIAVERFSAHMQRAVLCIAKGFDHHFKHQKDVNPELMIGLLCHGPLEQGRDATDGTLEFYNMCVDGSGLATVADSFAALEQRVEREGRLSWAEEARASAEQLRRHGRRARTTDAADQRAVRRPGHRWAMPGAAHFRAVDSVW